MELLLLRSYVLNTEMEDFDLRGIAAVVLVFIAGAMAIGTYFQLQRGEISLQDALTPGWVDFAVTYPVLFSIIAVLGVLILGKVFVAFLDSI